LVIAPLDGGSSDGGDRGAADVTLQAATPTLAAMVQDWDRAPEVSDVPEMAAPDAAGVPQVPAQDMPVARTVQPTAPTATPQTPDLPQAETRLPAPATSLAQTEAAALPLPDTSQSTAFAAPDARSEPRLTAPQRPDAAGATPSLPKVDTAPAANPTAPVASLRPALRPDRPLRRTEPAPRPQSTSRPKQTAKGSGARQPATSATARKAPAASGPSKAQLASLQRQWGAQITSALRRAHRPPRGLQGSVHLVISITPAGRVNAVSLAASSGNARLDQAALAAVKRARFPRAPDGLTSSSYRFSQRLTVSR
jgi:protein TonB